MAVQMFLACCGRNHIEIRQDRLPPGSVYVSVTTDDPPETEEEIRAVVDKMARLLFERMTADAAVKEAV